MPLGEVFQFIGVILCSFLLGALVIVCVFIYLFYEYTKHLPRGKPTVSFGYEKVILGKLLHQSLHGAKDTSVPGENESCNFLNLFLLFLFREWRDTVQLQRWVLRKINIEIQEFMETKAASRLLNGIKIHDLTLGKNFPVFHNAVITEPIAFSELESPEKVVVDLDMEYNGGFKLAVDVDLAFGKTAFLAVCISYLKGRVRIIFNRVPCTHWSIAFVSEPEVKFDIETSFENLQLPQVASLIVNQMKRTIRRKHTIPHYKLRYNPLFSFQHPEESPFKNFISDITIQPSVLEVSIDSCTRILALSKTEKDHSNASTSIVVFCTLSVDDISCRDVALHKTALKSHANHDKETLEAGTSNSDASTGALKNNKSQNSPFSLKSNFSEFHKSLRSFGRSTKSCGSLENLAELPHDSVSDSPIFHQNTQAKPPTPSQPFLLVMPNLTATLEEEQNDNRKTVIITRISSQPISSGLSVEDEIIAINGEEISSLGQAIVVINKLQTENQSYTFRVKRRQSKHIGINEKFDNVDYEHNNVTIHDNNSEETESDHSDVEDGGDNSDFINISSNAATTADYYKVWKSEPNLDANTKPENTNKVLDPPPYLTLSDGSSLKMENVSLNEPRKDKRAYSTGSTKKTNRSRSPSPANKKVKEKSEKHKIEFSSSKNIKDQPSTSGLVLPELLSEEAYRISSAFRDLSDKPIPFPIPSRPSESLQFARVTDNSDTQLFKTSLAQYNDKEMSWKTETFSFNVKEEHKYLNIRIWTQKVTKSTIVTDKPPHIVGCLSVPLCELELNCAKVTSHRVTQRIPVTAPIELPISHKWYMNSYFAQRSSFRDQYCHGDVVVTTRMVSLSESANSNNNSNVGANKISENTHDEEVMVESREIAEEINNRLLNEGTKLLINDADEKHELSKKISGLISKKQRSMKKSVSSSHHAFDRVDLQSRFTKPQKCKHCNSKMWIKTVVQCKNCRQLFHPNCLEKLGNDELCTGEIQQQQTDHSNSMSTENSKNATELTDEHKEAIFNKSSEDLLAMQAKDFGRNLHRDLPNEERRDTLNALLKKVEKELHSEILEKENVLEEQCKLTNKNRKWNLMENKILKLDERLQSLALLMLYYKSGLEDCDDVPTSTM